MYNSIMNAIPDTLVNKANYQLPNYTQMGIYLQEQDIFEIPKS